MPDKEIKCPKHDAGGGPCYCHTETTREIMIIPADPRHALKKQPLITSEMKARCIGEFTYTVDEPCPKCALHLDEHYDDIQCLCAGDDEQVYKKELTVPWDTCKQIYKAMAAAACQIYDRKQQD